MSFSSEVKKELLSIKPTAEHCILAQTIAREHFGKNKLTRAGKFRVGESLEKNCCKRAYIRGAFIESGSLNAPEKAYHLEFINPNREYVDILVYAIEFFDIRAKVTERKGHWVVYFKEGEHVVDLLNIMGAHNSLLNFENARIVKNMRNNVNRIVNCETANLSKTVTASIKQINDIKTIARITGLGYLSTQLKEVALIRLKYEEATLKEIGVMLSPPVGKSGVNHRLRKISGIAENLRGGKV
ncbi:MAG: DNA-binding protein WhiA [Clostridiales bacterium]|jgi:DNA-binding protein WhiA|nr:DNA-binding protein WhiA [Clostridiales bacterium]